MQKYQRQLPSKRLQHFKSTVREANMWFPLISVLVQIVSLYCQVRVR
jgi:hypothetical protein